MPHPPAIHQQIVLSDWVDYNGHMNVAYYVLIFDHATDVVLEQAGLNEAYRDTSGGSVFVVESHITYGQEVLEGDTVEISSQILNVDDKRLHLFHTMHPLGSGETLATIEIMLLHVDLETRRTSPFPSNIRASLKRKHGQDAQYSKPALAGRQVTFSKKA